MVYSKKAINKSKNKEIQMHTMQPERLTSTDRTAHPIRSFQYRTRMCNQRGLNRLCRAMAVLAVLLLSTSPLAGAREESDPYTAYGTATITHGNVAAARDRALFDAQGKIVMAAVSRRMSLDELKSYFLTLHNLFYVRPDLYLQRFKIVSESALLDRYTMVVEGFVDTSLLRADLSSMGMLEKTAQAVPMLVMVAEYGTDGDMRAWWSAESMSGALSQKKLEQHLRQRGAQIVVPTGTLMDGLSVDDLQDMETLCSYAGGMGAGIVVAGTAKNSLVTDKKRGSVKSVQCDMDISVVDVQQCSVALQTTTHALGMHIDIPSATAEAVNKACNNIAGQITDVLYMQLRQKNSCMLKIDFGSDVPAALAERFIAGLRGTLPDTTLSHPSPSDRAGTWESTVQTSLEIGSFLQKLYGMKVDGFSFTVLGIVDGVVTVKASVINQ